MQTPLFVIVCVIATFTVIEASPWFRRNPTKRVGEGKNNGATDFGTEEFGVNGGVAEKKSGASLTLGDQNPDENQDEGENVDNQGVTGYHAGQGFQTPRRNQGGYGHQGGYRRQGGNGRQGGYGQNNDRESIGDQQNQGGQGYPGSRGIQGGRGNQGSDDGYNHETSDEEDRAALRWQQESLRQYFNNYGRYQYGNRYKYPSEPRYPRYRDNWDRDSDNNGDIGSVDRNVNPTWKKSYGGYFNGDEGRSRIRGQAGNMSPTNGEDDNRGQAGINGHGSNWEQTNNDGENRHKNQRHNSGSERSSGEENPNILNIGNGVGNINTVHLPSNPSRPR